MAGGATFIAVQSDALDFTVEFDGRPFTSQQLQDLFSGSELFSAEMRFRKLALGLNAAFTTGVDTLHVETWNGSSGVRLVMTPTSQSSQPVRVCPMVNSGSTTRIRLLERAKLRMVTKMVTRFQNAKGLPELEALKQRCCHAGPTISVNGLRINEPVDLGACFSWRQLRPNPLIPALELTGVRPKRGFIAEKASTGPFYALIALGSRFPETKGLRVVAGGVLVSVPQTLILRDASVVAAAYGLEGDITNTQAVMNETCGRLVELINAELLDMGLELFRERHRVEADELGVAAAVLEDLSQHWELEGRLDGAQEALEACVDFRVRQLGPVHPELLPSLERLADLCRRTEKDERLLQLIEQQVPILREQARNHLQRHRSEEGVMCLQRALEMEERLAHPPPDLAQRYHELAVLMKEFRLPGSEGLFLKAVALQERHPEADPARNMESLRELADRYRVNKQFIEAESTARKALELAEKTLGEKHTGLVPYLKLLADILKASGRYGEGTDYESRAMLLKFRRA